MVALQIKELDLSVVLVAFFACLGIIIPVLTAAFLRAGRAERKTDEVAEVLSTGNSKSVGELVYRMSDQMEMLTAKVDTTRREVIGVLEHQSRMEEKLDDSRMKLSLLQQRFTDLKEEHVALGSRFDALVLKKREGMQDG